MYKSRIDSACAAAHRVQEIHVVKDKRVAGDGAPSDIVGPGGRIVHMQHIELQVAAHLPPGLRVRAAHVTATLIKHATAFGARPCCWARQQRHPHVTCSSLGCGASDSWQKLHPARAVVTKHKHVTATCAKEQTWKAEDQGKGSTSGILHKKGTTRGKCNSTVSGKMQQHQHRAAPAAPMWRKCLGSSFLTSMRGEAKINRQTKDTSCILHIVRPLAWF